MVQQPCTAPKLSSQMNGRADAELPEKYIDKTICLLWAKSKTYSTLVKK